MKLVKIVFDLARPTRGLLRETLFFSHSLLFFLGILRFSRLSRQNRQRRREGLAGAEGFEPPLAVLETAGLPLNLRPYDNSIYSVPRGSPGRPAYLISLCG